MEEKQMQIGLIGAGTIQTLNELAKSKGLGSEDTSVLVMPEAFRSVGVHLYLAR